MKILIYDILQKTNLPAQLKSPALADIFTYLIPVPTSFSTPQYIDCIGIGYTNATEFTFRFTIGGAQSVVTVPYTEPGLYMIPAKENVTDFTIECNGTYIGRVAAGRAVKLGTGMSKELNYISTAEPRITLSGQVISGVGGYRYRKVGLDTRYKITEADMQEIILAREQLSLNFPFFILLDDEAGRLPFLRLYANDTNQQDFSFESSLNKYLFSRKFNFEERF